MKRIIPIYENPIKCPHCGHILSAHSGDQMPEPGDVSICYYCQHPSIFIDHFRIRKPKTKEEIQRCAEAIAELLDCVGGEA